MSIVQMPSEFDKQLQREVSSIAHSWRYQSFYSPRLEQGARKIKSMFIQAGWSPPDESPKQPPQSPPEPPPAA